MRGRCRDGRATGRDRFGRRNPRHTTGIEDLAAALRAHAKGLYPAEAAAELLIGQRSWLRRGDFVNEFIEMDRALACGWLASIDWDAAVAALEAGRLSCSSGEARVLRLAASLAAGRPVDLGDALTGLDETNLTLVAEALLHAGGRRRVPVPIAAPCPSGRGPRDTASRPRSGDDAGTTTCPVCDEPFAPTGRQLFCSSPCRKTAFRRRRQHAVTVVVPAARPRRPHTVYECPACGTRALGEQRCPDCGSFGHAVGVGGLCPHCDEPVAVIELVEQ